MIADTHDALILNEPNHPPRVYFPREDVATEYMGRSDGSAYDPNKGSATLYTLLMDGHFAEHGVWAYETPAPGFEALAGRLAFVAQDVEVYDIEDNEPPAHPRTLEGVSADSLGEVVQPTDSGVGAAQDERWTPRTVPDTDDGGLR